ncbi:MAG: LytTR family transcriptional regulator DNA-binding domain-containing protein [Anaerolineae bacterium]|nr:LytTR family transcriptional regulator DNA-binding domain-containing protein [Anaerolineae bacterium]
MIELKNLQKIIEQTLVIDIAALTVRPGEIAAVVGPVGSGQAPLLDLLLGRTRPTAGTVRLGEVDPPSDKTAFSRQVGVLFAEDSLYKNLSAQANLVFQCRLRGLPKSRADEVLTQVGLVDRANVGVEKLGSGLARRLAFGRAILHRPQTLILVDPFARCDEASITLIERLIRRLAEQETTILILADDDAHLTTLCDSIHTLEKGRISQSSNPQDAQHSALPFKIPVKMEDKVALVNPGDILYAAAQEGRAVLQTHSGSLPTQFTLAELEERLARSGFFRAHRGYLVNLQHVKEVIPYTRNSFTLILDDAGETEIPLSKSAAGDLRELLGY